MKGNATRFESIPPIYAPSLTLTHGQDDYVFDEKGRKYIDFTGGIAVNAFGHRWDVIGGAVRRQMEKLMHCSGHFTTPAHIALTKELVEFANDACKTTHFFSAYLCNSGTEANEAALKFARLAAKKITNGKKIEFVAFSSAFHGRTLGSLSVTANTRYKQNFTPLLSGCRFLPFNDGARLEEEDFSRVAAIIVEPLQGEGGLDQMKTSFADSIMRVAKNDNVFVISDEVQSGLYRTGSALAGTECGLTPDIVTLAKSLGGGLPMGATIMSKKIASFLSLGDHGSTLGGNPVCCAAARAVLKKLRSPITHHMRKNSARYLERAFKRLTARLANDFPKTKPHFVGRGHLLGITFDPICEVSKFIEAARAKGLLVLRSGDNTLRCAPSFFCSRKTIRRAFRILKTTLVEECKHLRDE